MPSTRIGTGQVSVASTATLIAPANENRLELRLFKIDAPNVYLGCNSTVTTTGSVFAGTCGATITLPTTSAVWGITTGASVAISYLEITQ